MKKRNQAWRRGFHVFVMAITVFNMSFAGLSITPAQAISESFQLPCPDMNGDGAVNLSDFAMFGVAMNGNDPAADFYGDGMVNAIDKAIFEQVYNANDFSCEEWWLTPEFPAACPDMNGDGKVDLEDFAMFGVAFEVNADGDFDGDGDTDEVDKAILESVYGTDYTCDGGEVEGDIVQASNVIASKVVCDDEAYLPNWGDNDPVNPNITSTTAQDWVDASVGHCWLAEDWNFQWAISAANPGNDLYGEAGDPWTTFSDGVPTSIPVTEPGVSTWFREVLQEGYIPFTGDNTDDFTAQFYCNSDVINNDNYDRIYNTAADQTYYCVGWNTLTEREIPTVEIVATKIVCTDEADLPNWGDHKTDAHVNPPMIDADTAADWIASHESCSLQPDWSFQWAPGSTPKPADNAGVLGDPWTTFGVTDGSGKVTTEVPTGDYTHIWVREVFQDGYVPFTNNATMEEDGSDISAEIYCGWDIWNYDNYDYADMQTPGETRYCVAWNTPEEQPQSEVVANKVVCDDEAYLPNWGDNDPANPNIISTTAQDWVDASDQHCWLAEGWKFQWAISQPNPGNDLYGEVGDPWTTFDADVPTSIPVTEPGVSTWFREVLQEGYIPFAGDNNDNYTAQFYCNSDVINNDNYDRIYNTTPDQTYYCVGWNSPEDQRTGTIEGTKYYDWDRSADVSPGDEPLEGWPIKLYSDDCDVNDVDLCTPLDETTTAVNGHYMFSGLADDEYWVCEMLPEGWTHTPNPAGIIYDDFYCKYTGINQTVDFFNYLTGAVHGIKWDDQNGNEIRDSFYFDLPCDPIWEFLYGCEPKLGGWTIQLFDSEDTLIDEVVTEESGEHFGWYWFMDLEPGTYTICEVQQGGWDQTFPNNTDGCHEVELPYNFIGSESGCYADIYQDNAVESVSENGFPTPICNFGNQESEYNIRVVKKVVPIDNEPFWDPESWTWSLDDETGIAGQDDRDVATHEDHEITETADMFPAGAYSTTWQCWFGAGSGEGRSFSTADLSTQPENGDHLVCEFTNTELPAFDLSLAKSVDKATAAPGDNLVYTLTWGVAGNTDVDVLLTDTVPTNTTFVSATAGGTLDGSLVKWDFGTVTPPNGGSVQFTVSVNANTPNGTQITNLANVTGTVEGEETLSFLDTLRSVLVETAHAASPMIKTVQSNQVLTTVQIAAAPVVQTGTVLGQVTAPKLAITKTVNVSFANPSDKPQYTITVTNSGTGAALNVTVIDTLPEGFTFGDGETTKTWSLGNLAVGESKDVVYTALISSTAVAGNYVNVAEAKADNHAPIQTSATLEVRATAVLGALAQTGIAARDIYFLLSGLLLVLAGAWLVRRTKTVKA